MVHVLAIFLDGFRYDYLNAENAPFLYANKRDGLCLPLQSLLGFSSSIKASLWTSTYPRTHGYWTYWGHVPQTRKVSPHLYRIFKPIPSTDLRTFSRQVMRYVLQRMGSSAREWFMASIPDNIMPLFSRLSPEISSSDEINGIKTLFGILRERGITCRYFTARDYSMPHFEFDSESNSFNVVFIPNFDRIGHRYGPFSQEMKVEGRRLDALMKKLVESYSNVEDFHILIFSDHGMAAVEGKVNVRREIEQLPLRQPKDYLVFFDSTLARFWFFSEKAKKMIVNKLQSIDSGKILTELDKKRFGIDFEHNWYGDTYFLMKPGFEIFPNYFVGFIPKFLDHVLTSNGMHGYDPSEPSQYGIFLYRGIAIDSLSGLESLKIIDIAPFVLKLFGLKKPLYFESDMEF